MIEKEIVKLKRRIILFHLTLSLIISSLILTLLIFYLYKLELLSEKADLYQRVYSIKEKIRINLPEEVEIPKGYFISIVDKSKKTLFGEAVYPNLHLKEGFLKKNDKLFFISPLKDPILPGCYIIVGKSISPLYHKLKDYLFILVILAAVTCSLYTYSIYRLYEKWLSSIKGAYFDLLECSEIFSHEVLTPLSSAIFHIRDENVRGSLIKARDLINSFLVLQKSKTIPGKKEVEIDQMAKLIMDELSYLVYDRDVSILEEIEEASVFQSPELIYMILKNVMENGMKYAKNSIKVVVKDTYNFVLFEVETDSVFFKDQMGKYKSKGKGYGLGTYILNKVKDVIGARIEIESDGKTKVKVLIPK